MIEQQYYDLKSDRYFSDLLGLAEHYDDDSDYYSISGLPSNVYVCELKTIKFGDAASKARGLLSDFLFEQRSPEYYSLSKTTARNIDRGRTENFYYDCDIDETPPIKGIKDLQRSLDLFTAINKPFWRLGGDSTIGLCILDRALRKIERENADVHCLWYPTKERIELTDRVWQSLKLKNWQLINGEWRAISEF